MIKVFCIIAAATFITIIASRIAPITALLKVRKFQEGSWGYGMFLNNDEYDQFCDAYAATKNIPDEDTVVEEFYDDKAFDTGFAVLDDDTFDERSIRHLDGRQHEEDDNFVDGFFLFSERQGGVLAKSTSCCLYPNIAAMADEFRKKFSTYLPEDFDYEGHLAFLCVSQYC